MIMHFLVIIALLTASGTELEITGDLVRAGKAYQDEHDAHGQVRILSRFLEEALYAGQNNHAYDLILILEMYELDHGYFDFWYARLGWSCGLAEYACKTLDSLQADRWLATRGHGLAAQYRGNYEQAVEMYRESWNYAVTARQRFYSALDLSFALLQTGNYTDSEAIASFLVDNFPNEGLPVIALALSLHGQNYFGQAMTILQSVSTGDTYTGSAKYLAGSILEDLE